MKAMRLHSTLRTLLTQPWAVFVWGAPGVGKSSVVRAVAAEMKLPVLDLRASLMDPTDLRGIPALENGLAKWCPPSFLPGKKDKPGILFLDELNAAPPLVQASMYQLILDRRVGEYELPEGWKIIAAGNRQSDRAVTFRMSSALSNRFIHLTLDVDVESWQQWAVQAGIHPAVTAFIRFKPNLLWSRTNDAAAFASPRSWHMVSDVIYAFKESADAEPLFSGIVGEAAAVEFIAFLADRISEKDLKKILKDPEKAALPQRLDRIWSLVGWLSHEVRVNPAAEKAAGVLLRRLPVEFSVVLAKDVLTVSPGFIRNQDYLAFLAEHAADMV